MCDQNVLAKLGPLAHPSCLQLIPPSLCMCSKGLRNGFQGYIPKRIQITRVVLQE